MKRFFPLLAVIAITACSSGSSQPKYPITDAQEVFDAFTQIDAGLDVGMNLSKYTDNVIAVKAAVEKYKAKGKANPQALPLFEKALDGHIAAVKYWNCSIQFSSDSMRLWRCQDDQLKEIFLIYPSFKETKDMKEAIAKNSQDSGLFISSGLDKSAILNWIWLSSKTPVIEAQIVFAKK